MEINKEIEIYFTDCPDCDGGDYRELETDWCGTCGGDGVIEYKAPVSRELMKANQ